MATGFGTYEDQGKIDAKIEADKVVAGQLAGRQEERQSSDDAFLEYLMGLEVEFDPVSDKDVGSTMMDSLSGVIPEDKLESLLPNWHEDAYSAILHNVDAFPKVLDTAFGIATEQSKQLNKMNRVEADKMNKFLAEQFYATEGYKQGEAVRQDFDQFSGKFQGTVEQMLSGDLPSSVRQQIEQASSERSMSQGLFGGAAEGRGVRDLGLTALDYIKSGQQQAGAMSQVAQTRAGLIQRPDQVNPGLADTGALASQYGSALASMTTISPTAAIDAGSRESSINIGLEQFNQNMKRANEELNVNRIASFLQFNSSQGMAAQQFNAQMNYSAGLSNLNYSLDQQAFEWNYKMNQENIAAQKDAAMMGTIGSIVGMGTGALIGKM